LDALNIWMRHEARNKKGETRDPYLRWYLVT
jgi:hypothetical protein